MKRKLLFTIFTDEPCRQTHAFLYAIDLAQKGHEIKVIIEGHATASFAPNNINAASFEQLVIQAKALGIMAGACRTASLGCGVGDLESEAVKGVIAFGVPLLDDMNGHAGIEPYIQQGYELVVF